MRAAHGLLLTRCGCGSQIPKLRLGVAGQTMAGEACQKILELGSRFGLVAAMRQRGTVPVVDPICDAVISSSTCAPDWFFSAGAAGTIVARWGGFSLSVDH